MRRILIWLSSPSNTAPISVLDDCLLLRRTGMHKDWKAANSTLLDALATYRKSAPEVAEAFSGLASAATVPGVLDVRTKELIALAIGIAGRCDGCIGFHTQAVLRHWRPTTSYPKGRYRSSDPGAGSAAFPAAATRRGISSTSSNRLVGGGRDLDRKWRRSHESNEHKSPATSRDGSMISIMPALAHCERMGGSSQAPRPEDAR